jgi:hypothetical protein
LYNQSNFKPNLDVTALLCPNEVANVYVSKTAPPEQLDSTVIISDAKVQLLENEAVVSDLSYYEYSHFLDVCRPFYSSDFIMQEGHQYTLKVEALGKTITKEVSFPEKVRISSIEVPENCIVADIVDTDEVYSEYHIDTSIYITIDDPQGENYYMIDFSISNYSFGYNNTTGEIDTLFQKLPTHCDWYFDDDFADIKYVFGTFPYSIDNMWNGSYIIPDINFNGHQYRFKVKFYAFFGMPKDSSATLYYKLITISKDLYRYYVSAQKSQYSQDNPFVEPVNLYSNIESDEDYGLITGYNYTIDSIIIQP